MGLDRKIQCHGPGSKSVMDQKGAIMPPHTVSSGHREYKEEGQTVG